MGYRPKQQPDGKETFSVQNRADEAELLQREEELKQQKEEEKPRLREERLRRT
jgi:hypothetical protein